MAKGPAGNWRKNVKGEKAKDPLYTYMKLLKNKV